MTTCPLTPREKQIAALVTEGQTTIQIAVRLGLSDKTVNAHRYNIYRKLGIHKAVQLASKLHPVEATQ